MNFPPFPISSDHVSPSNRSRASHLLLQPKSALVKPSLSFPKPYVSRLPLPPDAPPQILPTLPDESFLGRNLSFVIPYLFHRLKSYFSNQYAFFHASELSAVASTGLGTQWEFDRHPCGTLINYSSKLVQEATRISCYL